MTVPRGVPLRIVGDVHGDTKAFTAAAETDRFVIQLGDLVDDGPDTTGTLRVMLRLLDEKRGMFILGNHDYKLARALRGERVRSAPTARTMAELPANLRDRTLEVFTAAPAWESAAGRIFVHGGFHPAMLQEPPQNMPASGRPGPLLAMALYGQTTGRVTGSGKPERLIRWVDQIPAGHIVYAGHDQRSQDGRPYVRHGKNGGQAMFLDTGAGKGGHLSWIDIDPL
jgi:protein phosphatase